MNTSINNYSAKYRPTLDFYHPNGKGTGCSAKFELHPAHDNVDGSLMLTMANQKTIGNRQGANPTFARFDWDNSVRVKLDFYDLSRMIQVLRGECETLENGRGIFHQTIKGVSKIQLRHLIEPTQGYSLEIIKTMQDQETNKVMHIFFNPAEALGLCEAITSVMGVIAFGIPMVIPKVTSEVKDARESA